VEGKDVAQRLNLYIYQRAKKRTHLFPHLRNTRQDRRQEDSNQDQPLPRRRRGQIGFGPDESHRAFSTQISVKGMGNLKFYLKEPVLQEEPCVRRGGRWNYEKGETCQRVTATSALKT